MIVYTNSMRRSKFEAKTWKPNTTTSSLVITLPYWIVKSFKIGEKEKIKLEITKEVEENGD